MKFGKKRIILLTVTALLVAIAIALNVIASQYWSWLMFEFAGAADMDFTTEQAQNALALGDEVVQEITEESVVLLKNENGTLPMPEDERKIALFGYGAIDRGFVYSGGGSSGTILNRDPDESGKFTFTYKYSLAQAFEAEGFSLFDEVLDVYENYSNYNVNVGRGISNIVAPPASYFSRSLLKKASRFSKTAMFVISRNGTESYEVPHEQRKTGADVQNDPTRTYLQLTVEEEELLDTLCDSGFFDRVIVLFNTVSFEAGFLDKYETEAYADVDIAALTIGLPGQTGTIAVPRILKGYKTVENGDGDKIRVSVTPSGRLADTYAYSATDYNPTSANVFPTTYSDAANADGNSGEYNGGEIAYSEGIYIGYRWYETAAKEGYFDSVTTPYGTGYDGVVQFPFGYGLSYTSFDWNVKSVKHYYGDVETDSKDLHADSRIEIEVEVSNMGAYDGMDVVELYLTPQYHKEDRNGQGGIEKAEVNLLAFAKTGLLNRTEGDAHGMQTVKIETTAYDMASFDDYDKNGNGHAGYELDRGSYTLRLMTDAHNDKEGTEQIVFNVPETINIDRDPVTGETVQTRFTGDSAYMDYPIDGSKVSGAAPIVFLSRHDFAGTFPAARPAARDNNESRAIRSAKNSRYDTDQMPASEQDNGYWFVRNTDGSKATLDQLNGNKSVKFEYNEALLKEIGVDYDSAKWDGILDQMTVNEICDMAEKGGFKTMAAESIGKPKTMEQDGPAGIHYGSATQDEKGLFTAFPAECTIGNCWSGRLTYNMGRAQGVIANATNIQGWYAPGLNLHRNPFSGRAFEYYSEDPVLTGKLGAELIRGAKNLNLYSFMKHFAVSEEGKNPVGVMTWLTEQTLREIYLRPFEIATKEGEANAVMSAFNCVGAVWSGGCDAMNNDILRKEWGFRGAIISDWSGNRNSIMQVEIAIRGGNDVMLDPTDAANALAKVDRSSPTSVTLCRTATKNVLYMWANTYAAAKNYEENGDDDRYSVDLSTVQAGKAPYSPIPVAILASADVALGLGVALCVFFFFWSPKKKDNAVTEE